MNQKQHPYLLDMMIVARDHAIERAAQAENQAKRHMTENQVLRERVEKIREENEFLSDELHTAKERVKHQEIIKRLNKSLTEHNQELLAKHEKLSDFLEILSRWLYKQRGNPLPSWADEFEKICKMMEPK